VEATKGLTPKQVEELLLLAQTQVSVWPSSSSSPSLFVMGKQAPQEWKHQSVSGDGFLDPRCRCDCCGCSRRRRRCCSRFLLFSRSSLFPLLFFLFLCCCRTCFFVPLCRFLPFFEKQEIHFLQKPFRVWPCVCPPLNRTPGGGERGHGDGVHNRGELEGVAGGQQRAFRSGRVRKGFVFHQPGIPWYAMPCHTVPSNQKRFGTVLPLQYTPRYQNETRQAVPSNQTQPGVRWCHLQPSPGRPMPCSAAPCPHVPYQQPCHPIQLRKRNSHEDSASLLLSTKIKIR